MGALVQSASAQYGASSSARSLAYSGSVTSGNLLAVWASWWGSATGMTVTDSLGSTYAELAVIANAGDLNVHLGLYVALAAGSGANTVSVTPNSGGVYQTLGVAEYSGVGSATPTVSASAQGTSASPSAGALAAGAGDLVIVGFGHENSLGSVSVDSGFTLDPNIQALNGTSVSNGLIAAYLLSAAGSVAPTFTPDAVCSWAAVGAAFPASGGGGGAYPTYPAALLMVD